MSGSFSKTTVFFKKKRSFLGTKIKTKRKTIVLKTISNPNHDFDKKPLIMFKMSLITENRTQFVSYQQNAR